MRECPLLTSLLRLRTEPRYLGKLAYLIPPSTQEKQRFAETVILTLYANAFSPLEELMLMDLLTSAVSNEIEQVPPSRLLFFFFFFFMSRTRK